MNPFEFHKNQWALILGGSSGFGLATAKKLSQHGMNICVVHRDRRGAMERIEKEFEDIRTYHRTHHHTHQGPERSFLSFNLDGLSEEGQERVLTSLQEKMGTEGRIRLFLHSIAFGNLKLIAPLKQAEKEPEKQNDPKEETLKNLAHLLAVEPHRLSEAIQQLFQAGATPLYPLIPTVYGEFLIDQEDMQRTIYSMGTSMLTWVQKLHAKGLFAKEAQVLGLTSEGNEIAWRGYAAVSAAKAALEAVSRSIAVEFAPYGIRSNLLQPGVTITPALNAIPGSEVMKANAKLRNPFQRLTQTEDVANVVYLLCLDEAAWINGSIIRVDGGEHVSA